MNVPPTGSPYLQYPIARNGVPDCTKSGAKEKSRLFIKIDLIKQEHVIEAVQMLYLYKTRNTHLTISAL